MPTASTGGRPSELEVLEPEPPSSSSSENGEESDAEAGAEADAAEIAEAGGQQGGQEGEESASDGGGDPAGGGAAADAGAEDPAMAGSAGGAAAGEPGDPAGGMPGDDVSTLDRELAESLGDFEGELQRQITVLASAQRAGELEAEARAGGGAREPEPEGGEPPLDQTGQAPGLVLVDDPSQLPPAAGSSGGDQTMTSGTQSDSADPGGGSNRQGSQNSARMVSRVPGDVGDGSDDDVVARQIREAAMNESDPVLREKLWEEYRNYKKAIR